MHTLRGYDAWLTRTPWDDYPDMPPTFRCEGCGRFLKHQPDREEPWEDGFECSGEPDEMGYTDCGQDGAHKAHKAIMAGGIADVRICPSCGHETKEWNA